MSQRPWAVNGPCQSDPWSELSEVVVVGILEVAADAGVALEEVGVVGRVDESVEDVAKDEFVGGGWTDDEVVGEDGCWEDRVRCLAYCWKVFRRLGVAAVGADPSVEAQTDEDARGGEVVQSEVVVLSAPN